jgi:FPC/CPF motif-containing protein YcgG
VALGGVDSVKDPRAEGWIASLLNQKNYPCVAALQSFHKDDYQVGFYGELGEGSLWRDLRQDLLFFLSKQRQSNSTHLTFWAFFEERPEISEEGFEERMWKELSFLTSEETKDEDWGQFTSDPEDKAFCLGLGGHRFFVVGLHPQSSRKARQFPVPALVFNVFDQFEALKEKGIYDSMVKTNRDRDVKFQGSVNPMALVHGDDWESIQFSGRANDQKKWKCPFSFMKSLMKP